MHIGIQQRFRAVTANRTLRLLFALLLSIVPLLSLAQTMPMAAADPGDQQHAMPCHGSATAQAGPAAQTQASCPHCDEAGAASQCQCCSHAAPAGLAVTGFDAVPPSPLLGSYHAMRSDALPCSPGERLYRPPIHAS